MSRSDARAEAAIRGLYQLVDEQRDPNAGLDLHIESSCWLTTTLDLLDRTASPWPALQSSHEGYVVASGKSGIDLEAEEAIAGITDRTGSQDVLVGSLAKSALDYVLLLCEVSVISQAIKTPPSIKR